MTERLYYDDSYLTEFTATVLEVRENRVRLDRSAFYPTSGGQPFDTGKIASANVVDVSVDAEGEVWHTVEGSLTEGETVSCAIDWDRRFDHMQQHAGEHMLASEIYRQLGGRTIGLHLGQDVSTIDVELPDGAMRISREEIEKIEDAVNAEIQKDVPIRCWFPSDAELSALPLRKAPAVKEKIRIVAIGQREMVACGGTHPSSSGQIGLLKIVSAAPARGKMRVSFVSGKRAFLDYRKATNAADDAALLFSTARDNLVSSVSRALERAKDAERAANKAQAAYACLLADTLLEKGETIVKVTDADIAPGALYDMAKYITECGAHALLAAKNGEGMLLLFARPASSSAKMGKLLSECCRAHGGKGGGKDDIAQGAAPDASPIEDAYKILRTELEEKA